MLILVELKSGRFVSGELYRDSRGDLGYEFDEPEFEISAPLPSDPFINLEQSLLRDLRRSFKGVSSVSLIS